MAKQNCWELKNCGREVGGARVAEFGECPASTKSSVNSINGGENGGRYCWRIVGTFCKDQKQGTMSSKIMDCIQCDFFQKVKAEQGLIMRV